MGYYIRFISKELKLKKDTPDEIINFINDCVNNHKFDVKFNHKLFTHERWESLFISNYFIKEKTYFKMENLIWKLKISCEINYGRNEILEFSKFISPYISGHKPKEFIGELKGEESNDRQNVYAYRRTIQHTAINYPTTQKTQPK